MGGGNIPPAENMINNEGDKLFPSEKTVVVDDDDKLVDTFRPAPLLSSCNDMIRPLSDAVHTLLCMNVIKEGIPLPTIVVIGDKSSGKTSVIESLTGISLPRGVSTRVPLIIKLQRHYDPSSVSQLRLEYKGKSIPVNEDRIPEEISLATDKIAGNGNDVSDVSLTLVVNNSCVPDLTIVDLPGIPAYESGNIYIRILGKDM
ncbi:dynamin-related protein 4A [Artemisia annua]|uniref:Dynamin-related protein 4A n=1 Tax=Artemisia annua TaxID=35608 RepID=A0A2U1KDU7_ARTAN|nr:dynamin-related protein 4A [Artemisia annua]